MTNDFLGLAPGDGSSARQGGATAELRRAPWALVGIIGTGQSLSVGAQAQDVASTGPSFGNLKLSLGTAAVPPFDADHKGLSLVPLAEPIRPFGTAYPSAYPENIYGETPHTAMASQITALARAAGADYASVHTAVGENGQGMAMLRKGALDVVNGATSTGRAYAATVFEVTAIQRLAAALGKTYGVGAVVLTHGETDAASPTYEAELLQLWSDYNADLSAITGQTQAIPLFVSQQHGFGFTAGVPSFAAPSTLTQWRAGASHPDKILCTGPKYQYPYAADNFHLVTRGYRLLGEKLGEIYFERVLMGRDWRPLEPRAVSVNGRAVAVTFHVPVPPLAWDEALPAPHQAALTEWLPAKGFELRSGNTPIPIESVALAGDTVVVTAGADIPPGAVLGYAATSDGAVLPNISRRWGQLKDSDPFVGALTNETQPNYAVAFEWNLP